VMVVEVDRFLDEPEAQGSYAEIEIVLRVVDRRGDMMKAENRHSD
jgi:hypothetical protein